MQKLHTFFLVLTLAFSMFGFIMSLLVFNSLGNVKCEVTTVPVVTPVVEATPEPTVVPTASVSAKKKLVKPVATPEVVDTQVLQ